MNIESYATISENAHIQGVALIPRISRNQNLYTKAELERFHNKTVPLNWEHDGNKIIGEVTFQYDATTETVYYEGDITDPSAALLAKNKLLYTSIEAQPTSVQQVCNGTNDCFHMPFGLIPEALALTETPGVPETSVNVMREHVNKTIETIKEHTKADHEYIDKYGASEIIHKTIEVPFKYKEEKSVDNIIQAQFHDMSMGLEAQIKQKNEALELFKKLFDENGDDITRTQIEMLEADIAQLSNNLLTLRGKSDYISVEHDISHIIGNFKEKVICDCCGEPKKN